MDDAKTEEITPVLEKEEVPEPVQEEETAVTKSIQTEDTTAQTPPATLSTTLSSLTDKALDFLSHASNETLGACLVGLGATTYLVLGRVGLVIIGLAGGVVLHATWEGIRGDDRDEETKKAELDRRREAGVEVMRRVLEWRSGRINMESKPEDSRVFAGQDLDYSAFRPQTAKALTTFTDAVITDYVYYWYGPTLPGEDTFPAASRRTFTAFVLSLSGHLQRKRPADIFLDFTTNASSIIIVFLNELAAAMTACPYSSPSDAVSTYLELKPDSSLSYLLDKQSQDRKLADAAEDMLQAYLDPKAYNFPPSHIFLKEVLAQIILGSTVTLCSRPEWINDWIVYGLEESETTKNVMDIVDAGVEGRTMDSVPEPVEQGPATRKSIANTDTASPRKHKRQMSKAEESMDDAMREAQRLTQLMIEDDKRRAREEQEKLASVSSSEDFSNFSTQGAPTPTSSQSDHEKLDEDTTSWTSRAPSVIESPVSEERPRTPNAAAHTFTSFDQIVPSPQPTALLDASPEKHRIPSPQPSSASPKLTLHNANIAIFDDSMPGERTSIKSKPMNEYMIQIEPSNSAFPGWMIARKYTDFETLHEVLRRISTITGVHAFSGSHTDLPQWRTNTKASLRTELERYLNDALRFQQLAESENMKRFLEKDLGMRKTPNGGKSAFGWGAAPDAFGKLGGDMMNVLSKAPKQVAGGGKAVFGGVTGGGKAMLGGVAGLVGTAGGKRQSQVDLNRTSGISAAAGNGSHRSQLSLASDEYGNPVSSAARQSQDSLRRPALDRHASASSVTSTDLQPRAMANLPRSSFEAASIEPVLMDADASPVQPQPLSSPTREGRPSLTVTSEEAISLPPPPSEMPADYVSGASPVRSSADSHRTNPTRQRRSLERQDEQPPAMPPRSSPLRRAEPPPKEPLSEQETSVTIELLFAVITELYTLSSAWNIRRTLLSAAKTFLLRPGNPQLLTIRDLLQKSLLDANLSDEGLASLVYKLRENGLPTEKELEIWKRDYPEKSELEKEELRAKARDLLVRKGMPAALQSVMGAAASGEALGRVFDALQDPRVSRGLIFGLMLQGVKVVTD